MNRPTDKQIEEVLAGIASPEDAKYVAEWFATEEGSDYLEAAMTQDSELIKNELADLYVDHDIPSKKILEQIRKNIQMCIRDRGDDADTAGLAFSFYNQTNRSITTVSAYGLGRWI